MKEIDNMGGLKMSDLWYFVQGEIALEFGGKQKNVSSRYYRYNVKDERLEYTDEDVRIIKKADKINWKKSNFELIPFLDEVRSQKGCWIIIDLL